MQTVTCLSVRQPWADLLVRGIKDVENRTWDTKYRGRLFIHASTRFDAEGFTLLAEYMEEFTGVRAVDALRSKSEYTLGAIIGSVLLRDVIPWKESMLDDLSVWHSEDMIGWYVEQPEILSNPVPVRGRMGLFTARIAL